MSTPWIREARRYIGLKEYPGAASNPTIMAWAKRLGAKVLGITYNQDATPWCALYVAHCMKHVGFVPPKIAVRASSWATWGQGLRRAVPGAILVFQRPGGGGHVGFACGESATAYKVLGGNQGDAVSETWIAKNRCVAIRWPIGAVVPVTKLAFYNASGKLSANEA